MFLLLIWAHLALAECKWGEQKLFGTYSGDALPEASGMSTLNGEIFFINDAEGDGSLYRYGPRGDLTRIPLDISPKNLEALSIGACGEKKCFYLADTGDNNTDRESAEIFEVDTDSMRVNRSWKITYQGGPRNVEAFFVAGNGDFYFLSKSAKKKGSSDSKSHLFHIAAEDLKSSGAGANLVGEINGISSPVTDMAISDNGKTVVVLSKESAFEFPFSQFSKGDFSGMKEISMQKLKNQESITFLSNDTLLWSTEAKKQTEVPIHSLRCR